MSFNPMKFPSRPFRFALVLKITLCFLAADASLAAADVLLIKSQEPAVAVNAPAAKPRPHCSVSRTDVLAWVMLL